MRANDSLNLIEFPAGLHAPDEDLVLRARDAVSGTGREESTLALAEPHVLRVEPDSDVTVSGLRLTSGAGSAPERTTSPIVVGRNAVLHLENMILESSAGAPPFILLEEGARVILQNVTGSGVTQLVTQQHAGYRPVRGGVRIAASSFAAETAAAGDLLVKAAPGSSVIVHDTLFNGLARVLDAEYPAAVHIRNADIRGTSETALRILYPGDTLTLDGIGFSGRFPRGAAFVALSPEEATDVTLRSLEAEDAAVPAGQAFITLRNASRETQLTGLNLQGTGGGTALRVETSADDSVVLTGVSLRDWRTGLETHGAITLRDSALSDLSGDGISVRTGSFTARNTTISDPFTGIRIGPDAQAADLGTESDPGRNTFALTGPGQFAIRSEAPLTVPAFGNTWQEGGGEILGHVAIDDMIDDGDADNPITESGQGEVLFERKATVPEDGVIVWDLSASRASPGYGRTHFRSLEEVQLRLADTSTLRLGGGIYPVPEVPQSGLTWIGRGPGSTILVPEESGEFVLRSAADRLHLEGLTLRAPEASHAGGLLWEGRDLTLRNVALETESAAVLFVRPEAGSGVLLEEVSAATTGAVEADRSPPAVLIEGDGIEIDGLTVDAPLPGQPLMLFGLGSKGITARNLQITGSGDVSTAAMTASGNVSVQGLSVESSRPTALLLAESRSGETGTLAISGATLRGFTSEGISVSGDHGSVVLEDITLLSGDDAAGRAAGLHWAPRASGSLRVAGLEGDNLVPAVHLEGELSGAEIAGVDVALSPAVAGQSREQDGIRIILGGENREPVTILGSLLAGFDNAVHIAPDHVHPGPLVFGNYGGSGANRLVRNAVGLRINSPNARVRITEDRNRTEFAENSVGVIVEAGELFAENARIVQNQTGVIVEGGTADLGGGDLESRGMNVLWPQAGAFAIINRGAETVFAQGNYWGDAGQSMGTAAAPIQDEQDGPEYGPVVTQKPDE